MLMKSWSDNWYVCTGINLFLFYFAAYMPEYMHFVIPVTKTFQVILKNTLNTCAAIYVRR